MLYAMYSTGNMCASPCGRHCFRDILWHVFAVIELRTHVPLLWSPLEVSVPFLVYEIMTFVTSFRILVHYLPPFYVRVYDQLPVGTLPLFCMFSVGPFVHFLLHLNVYQILLTMCEVSQHMRHFIHLLSLLCMMYTFLYVSSNIHSLSTKF